MSRIPKHLLESLERAEWKEYAGDNPMYRGYFVKDGMAINFTQARTMKTMFHVNIVSPTLNKIDFIHINELTKLIEGEN
jgi:hypothetical protein